MAEIGRWNNHVFTVSPSVIRSFTGLSVKGSSNTEEKESSGQKYVKRKSSKPAEVSITVMLSALTGNEVRKEAMALVDEARKGASDYFYIGGQKLVTCKLMLTEASVSEAELTGSGEWVSCKVQLSMKQASKYDGESGDSGSSSKKKSSKKKSVKKSSKSSSTVAGAVKGVISGVAGIASGATSLLKKATSSLAKVVSNAKKSSAAKKKTSSNKVTASKTKSKIKKWKR